MPAPAPAHARSLSPPARVPGRRSRRTALGLLAAISSALAGCAGRSEPTDRGPGPLDTGLPEAGAGEAGTPREPLSEPDPDSAVDLYAVSEYDARGIPRVRCLLLDAFEEPVGVAAEISLRAEDGALLHACSVGPNDVVDIEGRDWWSFELPTSTGVPRWSGAGLLYDFWSSLSGTALAGMSLEVLLGDGRSFESAIRSDRRAPSFDPGAAAFFDPPEGEADVDAREVAAMMVQILSRFHTPANPRQPVRVVVVGVDVELDATVDGWEIVGVPRDAWPQPEFVLTLLTCETDRIDVTLLQHFATGGSQRSYRFWRGEGRVSLSAVAGGLQLLW